MSEHSLRRTYGDLLTAIHFLTRIPVPSPPYRPDSLAESVKFFPVVGLFVGALAGILNVLIVPHLSRLITSIVVISFLVLLTGCLHEDGLADAADGFGGGWNRDQILTIMHDSRIGSYGAVALTLSLVARISLLSSIQIQNAMAYLIAANVLSRWTALPLSYFLLSAHRFKEKGEVPLTRTHLSDHIAGTPSMTTLIWTTLISFAGVVVILHWRAIAVILSVTLVTFLTGFFYKRRLGGVTGDCFGATNQLTEIAVYFVGAWIV